MSSFTRQPKIIPEVIRVVPEKRTGSEVPFTIPNTCPVCESPTVRREGEAAVRCTNKHCPAIEKETNYPFCISRCYEYRWSWA